MKKIRFLPALAALLAAIPAAHAGVDEVLKSIQESEFVFARVKSDVPFQPIGWVQNRSFASATFEDRHGGLPGAEVRENTFAAGAVLPVYIAKRDLIVLGADLGLDRLEVRSGPYADQSVQRVTPVAGWLHQFGTQDMLATFVAPIFSRETNGDQPWGTSGYGGVVCLHWYSDEFQLLYGGVYSNTFGQSALYPYAGIMWLPCPKLAVSLVFPWPTITYAPTDRWILQLGVAPGGSSWVRRGAGYESTQSFGPWLVNAGAGYRFYGKFWAVASVGLAGLRGVEIDTGGSVSRLESKPGAVFTLAVQFRP